MAIDFLYPQYEVVRNYDRCICCRACERQCANEVHFYDPEFQKMQVDESKCVACHRCVSLCPTRALKVVKTDHTFKENANWTGKAISEVYRQAGSGGVLLSSMGNPEPYPIYWDKILINASQVTNPSIDPLREPMETKTFLGKKPGKIERDKDGNLVPNMTPQLELNVPIMFSAMSYGSISYNAHASLARAACALGTYYNTGEGGLHKDFYQYGPHTIVQVASGRFGVHKDYLEAGAAIEIKMGQGAKPGIGGHLPGLKVGPDISKTSNFPARSARASVKAPLTWPNSSLSKSVSGTAPISTETISSPLRAERLCISRASISLPVPFSPVIRMLASVAATFSTISRMRAMAGLSPQNIGCSEASSRLISLSCFTSRADRARL